MIYTEDPIAVSVCCIAFNHAEHIRQCLDGIIAQKTNFKYEIIINDDCSTDGTTEIIKEYTAKYPKLIRPIFHKENQWSKGIKRILATFVYPLIRGKYIALCEGDDYWTDPDKLQKQVDYLESHDDVSMTFHNAKIIRINPEIEMPSIRKVENREYSASELFENWVVPTASIVFRNTVLQYEIKEPEKILNGDIFLVEQCAHSGKVVGMADEMSAYRIHNGGVTYDKKRVYSRMLALPDHYECLALNFPKIDRSILKSKLSDSYYNRGRNGKAEDGIHNTFDILKAFSIGGIKLFFRIIKRKF